MDLEELAREVVDRLDHLQQRVVFAESCTAGLISATLGRVPGVSAHLCGSAVVYRAATKSRWLGVKQSTLDEHSAVSCETTAEIARQVLHRTPEAHLSLGITGHFGPNAPDGLDGVIFLSVWKRKSASLVEVDARRVQLRSLSRAERYPEAASLALSFLLSCLTTDW